MARQPPKLIFKMARVEAIETIEPTAIIGLSGRPGLFTQDVIRAMARLNEHPVVFALSNPVSEISVADAYAAGAPEDGSEYWTYGEVMDRLPGGEADKLKVTLADGRVRYDYVDAASHQLVRSDKTEMIAGRELVMEESFSDFREVDGLFFPHHIETHVINRPETITITVETVELNPEIDEAQAEQLRADVMSNSTVFGLLVSPDLKSALIKATFNEGQLDYVAIFEQLLALREEVAGQGGDA